MKGTETTFKLAEGELHASLLRRKCNRAKTRVRSDFKRGDKGGCHIASPYGYIQTDTHYVLLAMHPGEVPLHVRAFQSRDAYFP